ncbi:dimethylhistidine N-methyltransferase [Mucilaginibacter sp. PPCGB 2223]|uniref:L-histidine N(alpha)-methyltransferase n=1 Tax=Mucilaginibacter sp. PPCGB 2223 TaxID=1886027 RepID=UPI00082651E0|nr:L-histidine N(alpha)-methyltransferase [Mucilaginibacter sp. PPCGB 2223]OCX50892.1 dimethylhistidine N-methyltransferase [Mucilaginibacter sp. PPCGB 2223]
MNIETLIISANGTTTKQQAAQQFAEDIVQGLSANPKRLDSKYFYDTTGDGLFQDIMNCPEYYLTNCELEIFSGQTDALANLMMADNDEPFDLIELGAGDAMKSSYLLKYLINKGVDFTYLPIDISSHVIGLLDDELSKNIPGLKFVGLNGEYFQMLKKAAAISGRRKVVLFLGSNIGNMAVEQAESFCRELRNHLSPGDMALIGFDLKKNPKTILDAYNDKAGITRNFNLNLLTRINRELDADFVTAQFEHYPVYDPESGACKSYLISQADQQVHLRSLNRTVNFQQNEYIFMEISQKFTLQQTKDIAINTGFIPANYMFDAKNWFTDAIWVAK